MQMKQSEGWKERRSIEINCKSSPSLGREAPGQIDENEINASRAFPITHLLGSIAVVEREPVALLSLGSSHPPRGHESIINIFLNFRLYSAGFSPSAAGASSFLSAGAAPSAEGSASDEVQRV